MIKLFKIAIALIFTTFTLNATEPHKVLTFNFKTIDGKNITVKEKKNGLDFVNFRGKAVLLEFWGTHCPPCLYSIEHYKKLISEYKGKLEMVAIEVQMTPKDELIKFAKAKNMNYNVVTQKDAGFFVNYVAQRAQWRGAIPFLIALDKDGNILDIKKGYLPENYVKQLVEIGIKGANSIAKEAKKTEQNSTKDSNKTIAINKTTDTNKTK